MNIRVKKIELYKKNTKRVREREKIGSIIHYCIIYSCILLLRKSTNTIFFEKVHN